MKKGTPKTIVVAVDTSSSGRSMFKEALVLASSIRARVVAVSVTPEYEGNMNRFFIKNSERQLDEPFTKTLREAAEYASSLGLKMATCHRHGKPCDEIVAVAREENAGLIVLGSSKRLQLERMLSGRTIEEIIVQGPCDVLLIPDGSEIRFNKIVVGLEDSMAAVEAGNRAFEVALSYGSEVHAVYAVDIPAEKALRYGVSKDAEKKAAEVIQSYCCKGKELGLQVFTEMVWSTAEKSITEYAKKRDISLIIISSKSEEGLLDMFSGSIVERIASMAACPILVTQTKKDKNGELFVSFFPDVSDRIIRVTEN